MAVLASVTSRTYVPQTQVVSFTVDVNLTHVIVTFTHANTLVGWPVGALLQILWNWGNGGTGTNQTGGGTQTNKDGSPIAGSVSYTFGTTKPSGVTSGTVTVTNLQTLTTAVLVEGF